MGPTRLEHDDEVPVWKRVGGQMRRMVSWGGGGEEEKGVGRRGGGRGDIP